MVKSWGMVITFTQVQVNGLVTYSTMYTNMERDYFLDKVSCQFIVITHDADCHTVTKELNIEPNRCFNKGDKITSKFSPRVGSRPHGIWAIQSESVISEELDVSSHIKYFQELLGDKIEIIEKLKHHYHFECVFAIAIETEDAGAGYDLSESELSFITKISSRYSCTFIAKENIT